MTILVGESYVDVYRIETKDGVSYPGIGATAESSNLQQNNLPALVNIPTGAYEDYTVNYNATTGAYVYGGNSALCGGTKNGLYSSTLDYVGININDNNEATEFYSNAKLDSSTYIKLPTVSTINTFEFICKFKKVVEPSAHHLPLFASTASERYFGVQYGNKFAMWDGSWKLGITPVTANTTYWVKAIYENNVFTYYSLVDNNYSLDMLPESGWTQEIQTTTDIFSATDYLIGCNIFTNGEALATNILYLNDTSIKVNGVQIFNNQPGMVATTAKTIKPTTGKPQGGNKHLYYNNIWELRDSKSSGGHYAGEVLVPSVDYIQKSDVDYSIVGNVNYSYDNNGKLIFNTFDEGYINCLTDLSITQSQTLEVQLHFNINRFSTQWRNKTAIDMALFSLSSATGTPWGNGLNLTSSISNDKLRLWVEDVLCNQNASGGWLSNKDLDLNTHYYINLLHTPTSFIVKISEDNISWSELCNNTITVNRNFNFYRFQLGSNSDVLTYKNAAPFYGKIYEEGTFVKIDDQLVWNLSIKE